MKYKVGDKVKVRSDLKGPGPYYMEGGARGDTFVSDMRKYCGKTVTIQCLCASGKYRIQEDHGRYNWTDGMLAGLSTASKIIITTDGKTTTAKLFNGKDLVKSAEAKCSPSDEFDFEKGAALAVDRLLGREEKPANPFKVGDYVRVIGCTYYCHGLAIGSVGRVSDTCGSDICEVDGFGPHGEKWSQSVHPCDLTKL